MPWGFVDTFCVSDRHYMFIEDSFDCTDYMTHSTNISKICNTPHRMVIYASCSIGLIKHRSISRVGHGVVSYI